jgi:hypothetical protein
MTDNSKIQPPSAGDVFGETYQMYLKQIGERNLPELAKRLNVEMDRDMLPVRLFGRRYHICSRGIEYPENKPLVHAEIVVLCQFVIRFPHAFPFSSNWVLYRDFMDAAPFVGGFRTSVEEPLAKIFSGKLELLEKACDAMGGVKPQLEQPLQYDLIRMFQALPEVPVLLLFNDADEEFPAETRIMFEDRADKFLDMESLAGVGWLLFDYLHAEFTGNATRTII